VLNYELSNRRTEGIVPIIEGAHEGRTGAGFENRVVAKVSKELDFRREL